MLNDDMDLVRAYAGNNSEQAFAMLVARHVSLVHSVALRQVGDGPLAQDVTQAVFIILARKAKSLGDRTVLSGWLCRTARYVSADALKQQRRRQWREQEAYMQSLHNEPTPDDWRHIAPLLDTALGELGEKDHNAIVLRYFENKSPGEVGRALGASEDAAKMRVSRALEKLRRFFAKRGVVLSTTAIAWAVSANSVQAAPTGLAGPISTVALTQGAAAGGSTLTLVKGALKLMMWKKVKTVMAIGTAVILVAGATTLLAQHESQNGNGSSSNNENKPGIAYKLLDDASQFAAKVDQTKFAVGVHITPFNKSIRPEDVTLTIQSAIKGPILIHLGKNGQLLDFPHDAALRQENPRVIHDQATGKMNMVLFGYLPISELTFRYQRLGDGIAEVNKAIAVANEIIKADYAGEFSTIPHGLKSVVFSFGRLGAGKATVAIDTASGRKMFTADGHGRVKLTMDKALLAENPRVTVSEKPQSITPDPEDLRL